MPIDPSISLQVRQPEFHDPLQSYAKIAGVRNMITQNALHQQQIATSQEALKTHQLANAEATRAQGAQRKAAELISANTKQGDNGEPVTDHFAVIKGLTESGNAKEAAAYDTQRRADLKSSLDNAAAQLKNIKEKTGMVSSLLGPVVNATSPEEAATLYPGARAQAIQKGLIKPEEAPEQYDPAFVQRNFQAAVDGNQQVDNHQKALDFALRVNEQAPKTLKEWSDIALNQASAARGQSELDQTRQILESQGAPKAILAQIPAMWSQASSDQLAAKAMTAQQRTEEADKKLVRDETAKQHEIVNKNAQSRIGIEREGLNLRRQQAGFEQGGGISEPAKMAAAGQMAPATLRALIRKSPGIVAQIRAVDPAFDEANIENRFQTLKEFEKTSNASAGGQAIALNTLIHHADLWLEAADALKNGSFKPGNAVYNKVSELFGSPAPQNAALVARFLAGETGKVATGGVPAEGEIKGILANLGTDAGPDQIAGAGRKLLEIAGGRATPLLERVKQAKIENVVQVLGPDAKAILARRGFDPETMKPTGSAAPQFKIGDSVMYNGAPHKITGIKANGKLVLEQ